MHKTHNHYWLPLLALLLFACEPEPLSLAEPAAAEATTMEAELAEHEARLAAEITAFEAAWPAANKSATVTLPAGSADGLADAIAAAGEGGTVLVEAGMHTESAPVTIPHRVRIRGQKGAVLQIESQPYDITGFVQPALHVQNAPGTLIQNLEIRPVGPIGGTAIFLDHSDRSAVLRTTITDHQFGIVVEASDRTYLMHNRITGSPLWLTEEVFEVHGIIVINGANARIYSNTIDQTFFGVWACDRLGYAAGNEFSGNYLGLILCNVPTAYPLEDGRVIGSATPATRWAAFGNDAHDNFDVGYLVIDGANNNFLAKNRAAANGRVDYDFAGDTERFGFFTPTSSANRGWISKDDTVLDCGEANVIVGGVVQDNTVDGACF